MSNSSRLLRKESKQKAENLVTTVSMYKQRERCQQLAMTVLFIRSAENQAAAKTNSGNSSTAKWSANYQHRTNKQQSTITYFTAIWR